MPKRLATLLVLMFFLVMSTKGFAQTLQQRPRYTLQPGDSLELNLRFTPEYNETVSVQPDGYIMVNLIGAVKVSGLTVDAAHDLLVKKLSVPLHDPELNLVLKDFQHPYVVVGGEVQTPGKIELRQDLTAMQAVVLAGGFKSSAKDTRIIVFRHINSSMGEVKILNLHNIQDKSALERDMALQPGDMILVPRNKLATFSHYMEAAHFSTFLGTPNW